MDTRKLNISETLESIRFEKRLNKTEFSELCGISNSFYSEIIKNNFSPLCKKTTLCRNGILMEENMVSYMTSFVQIAHSN